MTSAPSPNGQSPDAVREAVARPIDPYAWECWEETRQSHYGSYGLSGEPEGRLEDSTCARWQHAVRGAGMLAKSLAKADAIIAEQIAPLVAQRDAAIARVEEQATLRNAAEAEGLEHYRRSQVSVSGMMTIVESFKQIEAARDAALAEVTRLTADLAQAKAQVAVDAERIAQMERWLGLTGDPAQRPTIEAMHELGARFDDQFRARVRENYALTLTEAPHDD